MDVNIKHQIFEWGILIALSCLASSYILFTMAHPIKYGLSAFMAIFIIAFVALTRGVASGRSVRISPKLRLLARPVLLCLSAVLLAMYLADAHIWFLRTGLAIIVVYTIPGYALLELTGLPRPRLSFLETLCFSFAYSLALSFLLPLAFAPLGAWISGLLIAIIALSLAIVLNVKMLWKLRAGLWGQEPLEADLGELIATAISCSMILFVIAYCYPGMTGLLGLDIIEVSRHVSVWLRTPELMSTVYPGFVLSEASAFILSDMSPEAFQSSVVFLNIYLVFSFLLLAKKVFEKADKRLPAVALLLFTFFAGLGWIYISINLPPLGEMTYEQVMKLVAEKTYIDVRQGGMVDFVLWYRPRSVALFLLFITIYSILAYEPRGWRYRLNIGLLATSLFFMHIVEYLLLASALLLLAFFRISSAMGLDKIIEGLLCSWPFVGIIYGFSWAYGYTSLTMMSPISLMLALTALYSGLLVFLKFTEKRLLIKKAWAKGLVNFSALIVGFFYLSSIMAWLDQVEGFSMASVEEVGLIPWFFYPVLLGLVGPLAAIGLVAIVEGREHIDNKVVALFLSLIAISILTGRLLTLINLNIYMGYKERRFVKYIHPIACFLAVPALSSMARGAQHIKRRTLLSIVMVGLAFAGSLSTFYSFEKWASRSMNPLSEEEIEALEFLREFVPSMRISKVLTVSPASFLVARKAGSTFVVQHSRWAIWGSSAPELALSLLFDHRLAPEDRYIIYMHKRDEATIRRSYRDGFLYSHLIHLAEKVFENEKVSIYLLPMFSPPVEENGVVLVLPDEMGRALPIYDLMSFGFFKYTTALELDPYILEGDFLLFPTDDIPRAFEPLNLTEWLEMGKKILVFGGGIGHLASLFFTSEMTIQVEELGLAIDVPGMRRTNAFTTYLRDVEFELLNLLEETSPRVVVDDDQTAFWRPTAWGEGTIGVPILSDDEGLSVSGRNSLRIEVESGDKAQWAIAHDYDPPANWTSYDFISFYWYGRGDENNYIVWIEAPDEKNRLWFRFTDVWKGWRKVFLPLRGIDGSYEIGGVPIKKITRGRPDLGNVTHVDIRLSGGNPSIPGTWYIDRVILDVGRWADVHAYMVKAPWVEISVFNGTGYWRACWLTDNKTVELSSERLCFSSHINATFLYGENKSVMKIIGERHADDSWDIYIRVKMPPLGEKTSKIRLRIRTAAYLDAYAIAYQDFYRPLLEKVSLIPLSVREGIDILAWYVSDGGDIPLLVKKGIGDGCIYYLNAWPLLDLIEKGICGFEVLRSLIPILELTGLKRASQIEELVKISYVIFEKGEVNGLLRLSHRYLILRAPSGTLRLTLNDKITFENLTAVQFMVSGELLLEAHRANMSSSGFYLTLTADELAIRIGEHDKLFLRLFFQNGVDALMEFDGPLEIRASATDMQAFLRTPDVEVDGVLTLHNTYVCSFFEARIWSVLRGLFTGEMTGDVLRVFWADVVIRGGARLRLHMGGGFSLVELSYRGDVDINPPLLTWDETSSLARSWPWFLISAAIVALLYGRKWLRRLKVRAPWAR